MGDAGMTDNLMLLAAIWLACMGIGLLCIALFSRRDDFETDLPDRIGPSMTCSARRAHDRSPRADRVRDERHWRRRTARRYPMTPLDDPRPFAEVLRDWMARHGLTVGPASVFFGASHHTVVAKWLAGGKVTFEPALRRAMTLHDQVRG